MTKMRESKQYDLEDRRFFLSKQIVASVKKLPKTMVNIEIGRQLIKSGTSVGANYIEANESLGKKDFAMRITISGKEAKESRYRLKLSEPKKEREKKREALIRESSELMHIFGAILRKTL